MSENSPTANEEWRPVLGYEGFYSVSSRGRIRRDLGAPNPKCGKKSMNGYRNPDGYLVVSLHKNGVMKTRRIHRLILVAFLGECPGKQTNHKNGNKLDNRLENLEWVTSAENILHAYRFLGKTRLKGSLNGMAKLVESDVKEIRRRLELGEELRPVGRLFGVSKSTVFRIKHNMTWKV